MDWKRFITRQQSFPLFIDRWEVSNAPGELVRSEQIDFANLHGESCGPAGAPGAEHPTTAASDDCALVRLLAEFDPDHPTNEEFDAARQASRARFTVLFWDFPGDSPEAWRAEYQSEYSGRLPLRYQGYQKVYVHPFIARIPNNDSAPYELVLQYWFFYPFDDGGNKHEGDWEHINVVVSPRSKVLLGLRAPEMQALLRLGDLDGDDPLVIKRVDHYVHNNVIVLDYAHPNVYQARALWASEEKRLEGERAGARMIFGAIRERAYTDRAETAINTHPIGYIGGDSKGLDLLRSLGFDNADADSVGGGLFPIQGTLNFWEYSGNIRYSVLTRAIQPYVKLGYGLSWYRLEDITTNGEPHSPADGPWIHQPSILRPGTFLPDEWSYGIGVELIPISNPIPLTSPGLSVILDYSVYNHPLGIPVQSQAEIGLVSAPSVRRPALSLTAVISW